MLTFLFQKMNKSDVFLLINNVNISDISYLQVHSYYFALYVKYVQT